MSLCLLSCLQVPAGHPNLNSKILLACFLHNLRKSMSTSKSPLVVLGSLQNVSEGNQNEVCSGSAVFCRTVLLGMPGTGVGHCQSSSGNASPPTAGKAMEMPGAEQGCFKSLQVRGSVLKLVQPQVRRQKEQEKDYTQTIPYPLLGFLQKNSGKAGKTVQNWLI